MAKQLEFSPVLSRIASEIRFRPTLDSWKAVFEAARKLEDLYDHWQIKESKPDDITLFSPEEKAHIRICYNRIIYANETSTDVSKMNEQLKTVFDILVKDSGVKELQHIGFRTVHGYKTKLNLSELTDVVYNQYYNTKNVADLPVNVEDVQVVIDAGVKGKELSTHIRMGPMHDKQLWSVFNSPFDEQSNLDSSKSYLFLDVDVYSKERSAVNKVLETKDDCISTNTEVCGSILKKLEV